MDIVVRKGSELFPCEWRRAPQALPSGASIRDTARERMDKRTYRPSLPPDDERISRSGTREERGLRRARKDGAGSRFCDGIQGPAGPGRGAGSISGGRVCARGRFAGMIDLLVVKRDMTGITGIMPLPVRQIPE